MLDKQTYLDKATKEQLDEIKELAESRLTAQLQIAIAADQRAITFVGFLVAIVTVCFAGLVANITADDPSEVVYWLSGIGMSGFSLAAILAFSAGSPADFFIAGNNPSEWQSDIENKTPILMSQAEQIRHYSDHIDKNLETLEKNANRFRQASLVCILTLVAAGIATFAIVTG